MNKGNEAPSAKWSVIASVLKSFQHIFWNELSHLYRGYMTKISTKGYFIFYFFLTECFGLRIEHLQSKI